MLLDAPSVCLFQGIPAHCENPICPWDTLAQHGCIHNEQKIMKKGLVNTPDSEVHDA
jgi:hypothetical protein